MTAFESMDLGKKHDIVGPGMVSLLDSSIEKWLLNAINY